MDYWALQQETIAYDLQVSKNRDLETAYEEAVKKMDEHKEALMASADTEDELKWLDSLTQMHAQYESIFRDKIVPEVAHEAKGVLTSLDQVSDGLTEEQLALVDKIAGRSRPRPIRPRPRWPRRS